MRHDATQGESTAGNQQLDFEHRRLMETIDDTCAEFSRGATRDSVLDNLGLLYVRISAHVALEEKVTRERNPEQYQAYKERCRILLERIGVMMDAFYDGRCHVCDKALAECLRSWFEQHLRAGDDHPGAATVNC